MPERGRFQTEADYHGTVLHELAHWTGHGSRLGRNPTGRFGSDSYAAEELVAELAAAFLLAAGGRRYFLLDRRWLNPGPGCIIFSQYYDTSQKKGRAPMRCPAIEKTFDPATPHALGGGTKGR